MMTEEAPLILLPGIGADARMFSSLRSGLPQLVTPPWIPPERGESLVDYARRFARVIDPGRPFFIGGASFGGVVAQEVAAVLPHARLCFVIGSMTSEKGRPWRIRVLLPITRFVGILPWIAPALVRLLGTWLRPATRGVLTQLAAADPKFLRWGTRAILIWKPSPELAAIRAFRIHGDRDLVFPIQRSNPDLIVSNAGHLISITHPQEVMESLQQQIRDSETSQTAL